MFCCCWILNPLLTTPYTTSKPMNNPFHYKNCFIIFVSDLLLDPSMKSSSTLHPLDSYSDNFIMSKVKLLPPRPNLSVYQNQILKLTPC